MNQIRSIREFMQPEEPKLLVVKVDDYYKPIPIEQICFFETHLGKVRIITEDASYLCHHNLTYLEEMLSAHHFFRCHRAFIVNILQIKKMLAKKGEPFTVIMNDKDESSIPVSQSCLKKFRSYFYF